MKFLACSFSTTADTRGEATITSSLPPLENNAVTLESAGGVDQPIGAMYLKPFLRIGHAWTSAKCAPQPLVLVE
jgi:hypothetical protein